MDKRQGFLCDACEYESQPRWSQEDEEFRKILRHVYERQVGPDKRGKLNFRAARKEAKRLYDAGVRYPADPPVPEDRPEKCSTCGKESRHPVRDCWQKHGDGMVCYTCRKNGIGPPIGGMWRQKSLEKLSRAKGFAARIIAERLKRNWTIGKLARESGISEYTVTAAEDGKNIVRKSLRSIADGLKVSYEWLKYGDQTVLTTA